MVNNVVLDLFLQCLSLSLHKCIEDTLDSWENIHMEVSHFDKPETEDVLT